jgi:hypothetical protein
MRTSTSPSTTSKESAWLTFTVLGAFVVWAMLVLAFVALATCSLGPDQSPIEKVGQIGDSFGIFNALASSLAAIFAASAYFFQRRQFQDEIRQLQTQRFEEMIIMSSEHLPSFRISVDLISRKVAHPETPVSKFTIEQLLANTPVHNLVVKSPLIKFDKGENDNLAIWENRGLFPGVELSLEIKFHTKGNLNEFLEAGKVHLSLEYTLKNGVRVTEHFHFGPGSRLLYSDRRAQIGSIERSLSTAEFNKSKVA